MKEIYLGTKFTTVFVNNDTPKFNEIKELTNICRTFHKKQLTPIIDGFSAGNLSFRLCNTNEFVITATGLSNKEKLNNDDFVHVLKCNQEKLIVEVNGTLSPSSETFMHYLIYSNNFNINAVFHGHNKEILKHATEIGLKSTEQEFEYGTYELANSVLSLAKTHKFFIIKNHGFVSCGSTMKEAKNRAIYYFNKAKKIEKTFKFLE